MSFHIKRRESITQGLRRIAGSQLEKAVAATSVRDEGVHEVIHDVRKRCKKLRGLVRLLRPVFPDYKNANATLRDAARSLSHARDAHSMIGTLDQLLEIHSDSLDRRKFQELRKAMVAQREDFMEIQIDIEQRLASFRDILLQLRAQVDDWRLEDEDAAAVSSGLTKTYRRGHRAMKRASSSDSAEDFHEWRKRTKYHWYHLKLLRACWPKLFKPWAAEAHRLSDLIGDDHDLVVLRESMNSCHDVLGQSRLDALRGLIDQRSRQLRTQALDLGARLYADKPKALERRIQIYWTAWRG